MLNYIVKRFFFLSSALLFISLITFFISVMAPGDPVELLLSSSDKLYSKNISDKTAYYELKHQLGLDLPLFYFSITGSPIPDTIYKVNDSNQRKVLERLATNYGDWENVSEYYLAIKKLNTEAHKQSLNETTGIAENLLNQYQEQAIESSIAHLSQADLSLHSQTITLKAAFEKMVKEKNALSKYIPSFHWYGTNNQYHRWIRQVLKGDFGYSYQDKTSVSTKVVEAFSKTFSLTFIAFLIAFAIGIPAGIYTAINKKSKSAKIINTILFSFYSLPTIWVASLLLIFLCGGNYLAWFPAPGAMPVSSDAPLLYKLRGTILNYFLPVVCWIYGSLAYINKQMQASVNDVLTKNFILAARAKGMNKKEIIRKHVAKASLLPMITIACHLLPIMLSGSFVIETVFQIHGMGKLTMDAFTARDYPVIFSVVVLTAVLIMLGNLLADILYAIADPRISFKQVVS